MRLLPGTLLLIALSRLVSADFSGQFEFAGAGYPSRKMVEGRLRLFARYEARLGERWYLLASAYAEGGAGSGGRETAGTLRPHETYLERRSSRLEIRLGYSNVVWGVLDEIQPTDIVNPLDVGRFILEGRSEARLPVPLARARLFLPRDLTLEALVAPLPRRGTFDQLDERSSPFFPRRIVEDSLPRSSLPRTAGNMEFGARLRGSASGVDWAASFYRDLVDFDLFALVVPPAAPSALEAVRPKRWMAGGELETVRGAWSLRGEGSLYLGDPLQAALPPRVTEAWSFQGGFGADRRFGESSIFLSALYRAVPTQPGIEERDEISLVGGLSHNFGRGTRSLRVFGVWNGRADSGFTRATLSAEIVENLRAELSAGVFVGEGRDIFGLLGESDFVLARLRIHF